MRLQAHLQICPDDEQCGGCLKPIPAWDLFVLFTLRGLDDPQPQVGCMPCYERMLEKMEDRGEPLDQRD